MRVWILILAIMLSGCSTVRTYAEKGVDSARKSNDAFLEAAEVSYCDGPTHGALNRRYGGQTDIQNARNALCSMLTQKYYSTQ